jgi:hypothetical protein
MPPIKTIDGIHGYNPENLKKEKVIYNEKGKDYLQRSYCRKRNYYPYRKYELFAFGMDEQERITGNGNSRNGNGKKVRYLGKLGASSCLRYSRLITAKAHKRLFVCAFSRLLNRNIMKRGIEQ